MSLHNIGIDFGATKTLVARWDKTISRPVLIRLRPGSGEDMPTTAHVNTSGTFTFGNQADRRAVRDPDGYRPEFKRELGIHVAYTQEHSARDLAREYLRWLKALVERNSLHGEVGHAVITMPTSSPVTAREELRQAAIEAEFASVEILDEATAAGLAFLRSRPDLWQAGALLVLDWGASTLEFAVLELADGHPQVISDLVTGNPDLGGRTIDHLLLQSVNQRLVQSGRRKLERRSAQENEYVRREITRWKIEYAEEPHAVWDLDELADSPPEGSPKWTSEQIGEVVAEKISEVAAFCSELLEKAHRKGVYPAGVLSVGGTSQLPALAAMLGKEFPSIHIIDWDQRVIAPALGAAYHAAGLGARSEVLAEKKRTMEFAKAANNPLGMTFVPVPIFHGNRFARTVYFCDCPVRKIDYARFVKETGRAWSEASFQQKLDEPAVNMHWHDANAFCEWLSLQAKGIRFRLPTDHEWSCAAGIGKLESRDASPETKSKDVKTAGIFTWGNYWPPLFGTYTGEVRSDGVPWSKAFALGFALPVSFTISDGCGCFLLSCIGSVLFMFLITGHLVGFLLFVALCWSIVACVVALNAYIPPTLKAGIPNYATPHSHTSPVGGQPNTLGLYDLGGNVWEWTQDDWKSESNHKVLRGASWKDYLPERIAASFREHRSAATADESIGFRCVFEPGA